MRIVQVPLGNRSYAIKVGGGFRDYKIKETDADGELLKALDASDIMDWLFKELGLSDVVELPLDIIGKSGTARHLRIEN